MPRTRTAHGAPFTVNPRNPTTYAPVVFRNIPSGANNTYGLNLGALYLQDQMEITRYVHLIGGLRFDHFDMSSTDRRMTLLKPSVLSAR